VKEVYEVTRMMSSLFDCHYGCSCFF